MKHRNYYVIRSITSGRFYCGGLVTDSRSWDECIYFASEHATYADAKDQVEFMLKDVTNAMYLEIVEIYV